MSRTKRMRGRAADTLEFDWLFINDALPADHPLRTSHKGACGSWPRTTGLGEVDERITDKLWQQFGAEVVDAWIAERPGTRPSLWWHYDAPRIPMGTCPGWFYDGSHEQPRRWLGGVGTPAHEVLAHAPNFRMGLPTL